MSKQVGEMQEDNALFRTLESGVRTEAGFWQGEVGIRSRKHQQMIADYFANTPTSDKSRFVTLSVEGNISSGKSTFLQGVAANCPGLQDRIHVSLAPNLGFFFNYNIALVYPTSVWMIPPMTCLVNLSRISDTCSQHCNFQSIL